MISSLERQRGMVWGSLIGDALALGPHWIYAPEQIASQFGELTEFASPATAYHPGKTAGCQTHYGDQTLVLLRYLRSNPQPPFSEAAFARAWRDSWVNSTSYRDHATRDTLQNMNQGMMLTHSGSQVPELGGAARIAPLLAAYAQFDGEQVIAAARAQTLITHPEICADAAELITRTVGSLMKGTELFPALEAAVAQSYVQLDAAQLWQAALQVRDLPTREAMEKLGLSCSMEKALPATFLILLQKSSVEEALRSNALAGGDSAARGLVIGTILGALQGEAAVPQRWKETLAARPQVEDFLTLR